MRSIGLVPTDPPRRWPANQSTKAQTIASHVSAPMRARGASDLVIPPASMMRQFGPNSTMLAVAQQHRHAIRRRFAQPENDPRFLLIAGPCSIDGSQIDDEYVALVFAAIFADLIEKPEVAEHIQGMMRFCLMKPRSGQGSRGLEEQDDILAYRLLAMAVELGLSIAMEVMEEYHMALYGELISLPWVGARNVEDTFIRHAAGYYTEHAWLFKNANRATLQDAIHACKTAAESHTLRITGPDGRLRQRESSGNAATGIIFRGWEGMSEQEFEDTIRSSEQPLVICAGHTNAEAHDGGKRTTTGVLRCIQHVLALMREGIHIEGMMVESYLLEGADRTGNTPGMSTTDPCLSFEQLVHVVEALVKTQRQIAKSH